MLVSHGTSAEGCDVEGKVVETIPLDPGLGIRHHYLLGPRLRGPEDDGGRLAARGELHQGQPDIAHRHVSRLPLGLQDESVIRV